MEATFTSTRLRLLRDRPKIPTLVLLFLAFCCCCEDRNEARIPTPAVRGSQYNGPAQQATPFKISSTGVLPTGLHGFQLGMTKSDARNRMPTLRDSPVQKSDSLYGATSEGFSVNLGFSGDRLYRIESELMRIDPRDAEAFDRSTIMHLGNPQKSLYKGPETRCWVWIDGDVRVRYEDGELSDRVSRVLRLEIVDYPMILSALGAPQGGGDGFVFRSDPIRETKAEWEAPSEPVVRRPLPKEVDGLRLGMEPWEVRRAVPGIEIASVSEHEAKGMLLQGRNSLTAVGFWDGRLYEFNRFHENVSAVQFASILRDITAKLGTPVVQQESPALVMYEWQDETIEVGYDWNDPRNQVPPTYSVHAENKKIARLVNSTVKVPQFDKVPQTRSFF